MNLYYSNNVKFYSNNVNTQPYLTFNYIKARIDYTYTPEVNNQHSVI